MKAPVTRGFLLSPYAPWLVFFCGLVLSCILWLDARRAHEERIRADFHFQLAKAVDTIELRMAAHAQILRGVAGLFAASDEVKRAEFKAYIEALNLQEHYPGILGLGFSKLIPPQQETLHIAAVQHEGFPNYAIHPSSREMLRTSIVFLEPFNWRNQRALGYDMFTEPARRGTMLRACDEGGAALSGRVVLVQETDEDVQPGTLLYLPLYQGGRDPGTQAARRANLMGWIYSPLRMRDLLEGLFRSEFGELSGVMGFAVWDHEAANREDLLYATAERTLALPGYSGEELVQIAGRSWRIEAFALPGFAKQHGDSRASVLLLASAGITLLLTLFLEVLGRNDRHIAKAHEALAESRAELQNIYDTSSVAIFLLDTRGVIAHANRRMAEMFAMPLEQLIGSRYESLVALREREAAHDSLYSLLSGVNSSADLERHYQRGEEEFMGRVAARTMVNADGSVQGVVGAITDITAQRQYEVELRIAAIAFASSEAMVVTDAAARVVRVNRAFTELTGYTQAEMIGRNLRMLHSGRHERDFYKAMWQEILSKGSWQGEIWNRHKNGEVYPQWQTITAVRDERGRTTHYVGSAFNISQRVAQDNEMRNLAFYDPLTGLANRRLFSDRLQHAFAKCSRSHAIGAVIYLDLDHFKELNDQLGHAEGDRLLQAVAERLNRSVREGDTVARLGGDEFVMLLEDLAGDRSSAAHIALDIAEGLRVALNGAYPQQARMPPEWRCTPSIGVALFCGASDSSATVMERADRALYKAKHAGRNIVKMDSEAA